MADNERSRLSTVHTISLDEIDVYTSCFIQVNVKSTTLNLPLQGWHGLKLKSIINLTTSSSQMAFFVRGLNSN